MNSRSGTLGIINRVPGGTIVPAGVVLVVASAVASGAIATQGWLFLGLACRCRVSLLLLSIDFLLKVALVQVLELVENLEIYCHGLDVHQSSSPCRSHGLVQNPVLFHRGIHPAPPHSTMFLFLYLIISFPGRCSAGP